MIDAELRARFRRLSYAEHWKVGTTRGVRYALNQCLGRERTRAKNCPLIGGDLSRPRDQGPSSSAATSAATSAA
jgi:hypothetical protein